MTPVKRHIRFLILFIIGSLTLSACDYFSSGTKFGPYLSVETDRDHYVIGEDEVIGVTIINISEMSLRYNTCLMKMLEVIRDGEIIETIGHPTCYCNCITTLNPGETINPEFSDFNLQSVLSLWDEPFDYGEDVEYQIMVGVSGSPLLDEDDIRSNRFRIRKSDSEN
ncbi:MAG: hypothetical protein JJU46_01410 [Balneolaceae bacterium]|nr:hypothetical protein [Balneolaceae bacterium]MCH8548020.1 hypothetical protein [Balneolaceae bacterium]